MNRILSIGTEHIGFAILFLLHQVPATHGEVGDLAASRKRSVWNCLSVEDPAGAVSLWKILLEPPLCGRSIWSFLDMESRMPDNGHFASPQGGKRISGSVGITARAAVTFRQVAAVDADEILKKCNLKRSIQERRLRILTWSGPMPFRVDRNRLPRSRPGDCYPLILTHVEMTSRSHATALPSFWKLFHSGRAAGAASAATASTTWFACVDARP